MIPLTDLARQHERLASELEPALLALLRRGEFILGEPVSTFEAEAAAYLGAEAALGVSSASDGLVMSLLDAGIRPGDEVITTPLTFVATAEAIARVGATPVFADVEPQELCLSPSSILEAISPRVRAVIVVHLFGHVGDLRGITKLCQERGLVLIEDAAQAFGAKVGERFVGTWGDYGVFSFFPAKVLGGAGDGGLIVSNRGRFERLRRLRVHGHRGDGTFAGLGGNYRLDALQATVLSVKLRYVEEFIASRTRLAERYRAELSRLELQVGLPSIRPGTRSAWNYYALRVPEPEKLRLRLADDGVASARYYSVPLHAQPCFQNTMRVAGVREAERAASELLAVPLFPELTESEQDQVVAALARGLGDAP
jgi:dTDP-4-amino-4,6-dideoxygalactose transaminase